MHGSARCLPAFAAIAALVLVTTPGCTRHFFRQAADKDVQGTITQKNIFPQWQMTSWHVYPDTLRLPYGDPTNPDRPPYPPDDFATRLVSPNPQRPTRRSGVGRVEGTGYLEIMQQWDAANRAAEEASGLTPPLAPGGPSTSTMEQDIPRAITRLSPHTSGNDSTTRQASLGQSRSIASVANLARIPEFGPWTAVKPGRPGASVADRVETPQSTIFRKPVVIVAGEAEQNGKVVPAVAVLPIESGQLPVQKLPEPLPLPKMVDPNAQPQPKPGPPAAAESTPGPTRIVSSVEDKTYLRALETKQPGFRLTLEQAVELAILNGREMQDRREDVFLSALDVTFQRFNFAAQGFYTEQAILRTIGRNLPNGGEQWNINSSGGFSKNFPTGADVDGEARQPGGGRSLRRQANDDARQPLVERDTALPCGGGKAVTLEPLTLVERTLLYATPFVRPLPQGVLRGDRCRGRERIYQ